MTLGELRNLGIDALKNKNSVCFFKILKSLNLYSDKTESFILSPTPCLDTDCILAHIIKKDRSFILSHRSIEINIKQQTEFIKALKKRRTGFPVAYITNLKEFYGYDFYVNTDVLIPKPDTELIIDHAVNFIFEKYILDAQKKLLICDMFCGSGCIAVSVLKTVLNQKSGNFNILNFVLADICGKALKTAQINIQNLIPESERKNISLIKSNLFENISLKFDLITANPPYIPKKILESLLKDGRSEPVLALKGTLDENFQSDDGLDIIRKFLPQAFMHLNEGGILLMEAGEYNIQSAAQEAKNEGFKDIEIFKDLSEQMRMIKAVK